MEGDFSSGAMVLVEYNRIKKSLREARNKTTFRALKDMIDVMEDQLNLYLDEALECDALVLATVLHPRYRLAFFNKFYPDDKEQANELLHSAFDAVLKARQETDLNTTQGEVRTVAAQNNDDDDFDDFTASSNPNDTSKKEAELDSYLMGQREFDKTQTALDWWKVTQTFIYIWILLDIPADSTYALISYRPIS